MLAIAMGSLVFWTTFKIKTKRESKYWILIWINTLKFDVEWIKNLAKVSLIAIVTQMVAEQRPESCIKNSVDNKKITCVLVGKNVKVEKNKKTKQ